MTGPIHANPARVTTSRPGSLAAEPVEVTRVVVPLDGSPFAERALPVAAWAASLLSADVSVVEVVTSDEAAEGAIRYLDSIARRYHASWDVLQHSDPARALVAAVARIPGALACLATHGRDRSPGLVGSVAGAMLDRTATPVLLAGPRARPVSAMDAPIVVAIDGTAGDETLVRVGLGWAQRLGRRLLIVTVDQPAPFPRQEAPWWSAKVTDDPAAHLASLADRASGAGVPVDTRMIPSPGNAHTGLVPFVDRSAALVVIGSRGGPGTVLGSQAARIVHDASVATLAVPLAAPAA